MAGAMDRRATFYSPVAKSDGQGGREDGWKNEFTVWSEFRFLRGSEPVVSARLTGKQPTVIKVRRSPDTDKINTDWHIEEDGVKYNIRSIIRTDDRRFYEMTAESGVAV